MGRSMSLRPYVDAYIVELFYRFILAASGVFLAYLGVLFVVDGLRGLV